MNQILAMDISVESGIEFGIAVGSPAWDIVTALAFFTIPTAFAYLNVRKKDPPRPLQRIFYLVQLFILSCGLIHLLNPFISSSRLAVVIHQLLRFTTPLFAIAVSTCIYALVPCFVSMPSSCELHKLNTELKELNVELQQHRDNLHKEVAQRTHELMQEKAKWKLVAETAPQILWLKNTAGEMEFYNKKWYEYTGLDPIEDKSCPVRAVHPTDLELMHTKWVEGQFSKDVSDYKIRIKSKDNTYRWHLTRCVPIRDIETNEVIQYCGISTDIHDTEMVNELSVADATRKSRFLAMISHEMRTPLTGIIGMATLLGDTILQPSQTELLSNVKRSADKLLTLVNNILDLFKLHNDKLNLEISTFELRDFVQSAIREVIEEATEKNITIHDDIEYDKLPSLIQADRVRLRQILVNIFANAVKFTNEGGHIYTGASVVDGSIRKSSDNYKKRIKFSIQDTGIGIQPEDVIKVFDNFSQVDSSSTRRFGGTGVGLAISKGLVELMRGNIWCESEPGKGATFHFTFEAVDVTYEGVVRSDHRMPIASKPLLYASSCDDLVNNDGVIISDITSEDGAGATPVQESPYCTDDEDSSVCIIRPRILVADDTDMNQKVLRRYLSTLGYTDVDVVSDGAQAVQAVTQKPYDIIFLDMEMPVMDGVTAATQIRALPPTTLERQPHIIAVTANAFQEDVKKCLDAGMCAHMAKPIKRDDIRKKMDTSIQIMCGNDTCTCHNYSGPIQTKRRQSTSSTPPLSV